MRVGPKPVAGALVTLSNRRGGGGGRGAPAGGDGRARRRAGVHQPAKFEQALRVPPAAGKPYIGRVTVRPAGGVDVVTLWVLTSELKYEPVRFAAPRRYRPVGTSRAASLAAASEGYSVREYLGSAAETNPDLRVTDAWWEEPAPLVASHVAAGLVLVGGVWPVVLRRLVGAGYGRDEPAYDLDRFHGGPEPEAGPTTISAGEQVRLRALEEEMLRGLTSAPGDSPAAAPEASAPVRTLVQAAPETAPAGPEEDKDFYGEFYPVAHPHHHDAAAHPPAAGDDGRRGFTLIELLVVIGLITLLTPLLLPTVRVARMQADTVHCAAKLRQPGAGFQMYVNNNNGWLPAWSNWATWPRGLAGDTDGPAWTEEMIPYLGDPDSAVYHCPSFPGPEKCRNYFLAGQWSGRNGRRAMKLTDVKLAGRFVLSGDKTQLSLYPKPSGTSWQTNDDADPDDYGGAPVLGWPWQEGRFHMHRGGNNILFDDMHVGLYADYDPHEMTFHPRRMLDWAEVTAE